jgi:hypothetical protein
MPRGIPAKGKSYYCIGAKGEVMGPFKNLDELKDQVHDRDVEQNPIVLKEVGRLEIRQRVALSRR